MQCNTFLIVHQRSVNCCGSFGHHIRCTFTSVIRQRVSINGITHRVGRSCFSKKYRKNQERFEGKLEQFTCATVRRATLNDKYY